MILATELEELVGKKNVIVIVNESKQELGMRAYHKLMYVPGIDARSAVGMVKELQAWGKPASKCAGDSLVETSSLSSSVNIYERRHSAALPADESATWLSNTYCR